MSNVYYAAAHIGWTRYAFTAVVSLSDCPVPGPTSRTEGHGKLKVDRKQAVTPFRVERSRSRSLSRLLPWPKSNRIFGTGRLTNLKLGKPREHDELYYWRAWCPPTWKLRRLFKSHSLGAGAYWGGHNTGHTACSVFVTERHGQRSKLNIAMVSQGVSVRKNDK